MARGRKTGGRRLGTLNRATIEWERLAEVEAQRERLLIEARAAEGERAIQAAAASGKKLMKEIGFEVAQLFAGLAAVHQPTFSRDPVTGRTTVNSGFDEKRFDKYATLAANTARDFASYESPKLSAVMLASGQVEKIVVEGGLPDSEMDH
jgi:hypothetical protein